LTMPGSEPDTGEFQGIVWTLERKGLSEGWAGACANDFEAAVFLLHPELKAIRDRLRRAGAKPALMSGSGSAIFGLFETRGQAAAASAKLNQGRTAKGIEYRLVSLVNRRRYQALWWGQLRDHISGKQWPPQTRY
jgi:4-diphosphocytidyl-2C-methyl-D-erythritol kinase